MVISGNARSTNRYIEKCVGRILAHFFVWLPPVFPPGYMDPLLFLQSISIQVQKTSESLEGGGYNVTYGRVPYGGARSLERCRWNSLIGKQ